MKHIITNTLEYFLRKPRTLFLLDGLGAALTSFSLYFVLGHYEQYFGMPMHVLIYLSVLGLIYCIYSISCFFVLRHYWVPYLRIIGMSNLLYCIVTMTLLYNYYHVLTPIGLAYFFGEILIIVSLVYIELRVANMVITKKSE
jgi:hypothetical protein